MTLLNWVIALVALQRLGELVYARRNEARLRAAGATESGAGHYPLFVLLHASWLAAIWLLADPNMEPFWPALIAYVVLQPVRVWIVATLGPRWTTRVIVLPGAPLVSGGPYRFLRHPNYALVVAEIALLPLAFQLWEVAVVFSLANLLLLRHRVRVEDAALAGLR